MIIIVIVLFVLLGLSDFPQLIKNKNWKTVGVLGGLYAAVFTLAALMSFGVTLPSPLIGIQNFIIDVLHLGYPNP